MNQSPLHRLPSELRLQIYNTALRHEKPIALSRACGTPALAQTCRQIRDETLLTYYSVNTFTQTFDYESYVKYYPDYLSDFLQNLQFLSDLDYRRVWAIRHLCLEFLHTSSYFQLRVPVRCPSSSPLRRELVGLASWGFRNSHVSFELKFSEGQPRVVESFIEDFNRDFEHHARHYIEGVWGSQLCE